MRGRTRPTPARRPFCVAVTTVLVTTVLLSACGDGTDSYCRRLAESARLGSLTSAIEAGDLTAAGEAAADFVELARDAPPEIRVDMGEIAEGVVGIVELLEQERRETSVSDDDVGSTSEAEHLRDALNEHFDDLDRRSVRVETWAARNCGLDLS